MDGEIVKVCKIHGELTKDDCYYKNNKQGRYPACRICRVEYCRKYRELNRDKIRERQKRYNKKYIANIKDYKENKKAYQKEWYQKNKERLREAQKKHYEENKERLRDGYKEYYAKQKNRLSYKEGRKRYRERTRERQRELNRKYRKDNKQKIKERDKLYRTRNKERIKENKKNAIINLPDYYVWKRFAGRGNLKKSDIPEECIEIYRTLMQVRRDLRTIKKNGSR